jgi:polyphosphate kinase
MGDAPTEVRSATRCYFQQLFRLQAELVKLQEWVVASGEKVLILFEGRDAAGKGGAIKRISQKLNPRVCRVVARCPLTGKRLSYFLPHAVR